MIILPPHQHPITILFLLQYIGYYTYSEKITAYITKSIFLGLCKIKLQVQL